MNWFTRRFESPLLITVEEFKARVKAYPVQPGIMKTVPFPMNGFLIEQVNENCFEVTRESYSRKAIIRAKLTIESNGSDHKVKALIWQDWRSLIIPFLFLAFVWISILVRWTVSSRIGTGGFIFGAFPLILVRVSWYFSLSSFRTWLRDGLMAP